MRDDSSENVSDISRRRWLQAAGTIGVSALAGCSSDGTGNPDETSSKKGAPPDGNGQKQPDGNGQKQPVEPILDEAQDVSTPPTDLQWNPFAATGFNGNTAGYLLEYGAMLFIKNGKLRPVGYESWNYDDQQQILTTTLRDDLKKWNGDPYLAQDLYCYDEIIRLQAPDSSPYEKIEVTGNHTIDYHLKEPKNPDIFTTLQLFRVFYFGQDVWQPWLEKYQDATTQSERDKITQNLTNFEITHKELMNKGLGTGAYKLSEVTDKHFVLKKFEEHRNADDISIPTLRIRLASSSARYGQILTQGLADFGRGPFPAQYKSAAPDFLQNLETWATLNNIKMLINWRNRECLQDTNFRRAMAAVINTKPIAQAANNAKPIHVHSGMNPAFHDQYLNGNAENYINYSPMKNDYELADQYLEKSGYSRENGTIYGPNGTELDDIRFITGTDGQWYIGGKYASAQLKEYGFPIKYSTVSRGAKVEMIQNDMNAWDLSVESHYAGTTYHPFSYYDYGTFWGWRLGPGGFSPAPQTKEKINKWLNQGKEYSPYNGKALTPEIPTTVGQQDLSGSTKEINNFELINEVQKPVSKERTKQIIQDLSWAWNFTLPDIDLYLLLGGMWGDTKNFKWPDGWPVTGSNNSGLYYIIGNGLVEPVYE